MDSQFIKADGLQKIPNDILRQGTQPIVQYILDLYPNPRHSKLYRTKLMVIGFENIGKTTLLDCLFPLEGAAKTLGNFNMKIDNWFKLQGKYLRKFKSKDDVSLIREYVLDEKEWSVTDENKTTVVLTPKNSDQKPLKMIFEDEPTAKMWLKKLKRLILNVATYGIEVNKYKIDHPISQAILPDQESFEMSVWDFAGQKSYIKQHHYFLSTRTVFLVVWKMVEGDKGIENLGFWFSTLSIHLGKNTRESTLYSIIVVGTFLDDPSVTKNQKSQREEKIKEIAKSAGLVCDIDVTEVSCAQLDNIEELRSSIFSVPFIHSYMGEDVPESYKIVQRALDEFRDREDLIKTVEEVVGYIQQNLSMNLDTPLVKRALSLLAAWGEIIYYEKPEELSNMIILSPPLLTQSVFALLFGPHTKNKTKGGVIKESELKNLTQEVSQQVPFTKFLPLLETLDVCFKDPESPITEQTIIVPSLLPEEPPENLSKIWLEDCPVDLFQVSRIFEFTILPEELMSRLLVRLQRLYPRKLMWKYGYVHSPKLYIHLDPKKNLVIVYCRSQTRKESCELMIQVINQISKLAEIYPGISYSEKVVSTFDRNTLIDLGDCLKAVDRKNFFRCPTTNKKIPLEEILLGAGIDYQ